MVNAGRPVGRRTVGRCRTYIPVEVYSQRVLQGTRSKYRDHVPLSRSCSPVDMTANTWQTLVQLSSVSLRVCMYYLRDAREGRTKRSRRAVVVVKVQAPSDVGRSSLFLKPEPFIFVRPTRGQYLCCTILH